MPHRLEECGHIETCVVHGVANDPLKFGHIDVAEHLWRAGLKEGEATLKDIDKALWYLNRERERLVKMGVK